MKKKEERRPEPTAQPTNPENRIPDALEWRDLDPPRRWLKQDEVRDV